MNTKRITIDISGTDYNAYATAARHLHVLMGKRAPSTRDLLNFEFTHRVPDWIADHYLDSTQGGFMSPQEAKWFKQVRKATQRFRKRRERARSASQGNQAGACDGRN